MIYNPSLCLLTNLPLLLVALLTCSLFHFLASPLLIDHHPLLLHLTMNRPTNQGACRLIGTDPLTNELDPVPHPLECRLIGTPLLALTLTKNRPTRAQGFMRKNQSPLN